MPACPAQAKGRRLHARLSPIPVTALVLHQLTRNMACRSERGPCQHSLLRRLIAHVKPTHVLAQRCVRTDAAACPSFSVTHTSYGHITLLWSITIHASVVKPCACCRAMHVLSPLLGTLIPQHEPMMLGFKLVSTELVSTDSFRDAGQHRPRHA
jgi:hypothetical protein